MKTQKLRSHNEAYSLWFYHISQNFVQRIVLHTVQGNLLTEQLHTILFSSDTDIQPVKHILSKSQMCVCVYMCVCLCVCVCVCVCVQVCTGEKVMRIVGV